MQDGGFFDRFARLFASMAWTWPTAMFFSAVVIMVIVTTMSTPPLLKWSLARKRGGSP